jgi:16S rRNA (adenine1518-N6/adenine1519-N6)-dimethyltransferase
LGIQERFKRSKGIQERNEATRLEKRQAREAALHKPNPLKNEARRVLARKRFGQNFLIHQGVIDGIVRSVEPSLHDNVLEIGPGLGFLTRNLIDKVGHLTAVELDRRMMEYLEIQFSNHPDKEKLRLISNDIMAVDVMAEMPEGAFKVVGNLPYNITSGVLFKFAGEMTNPDMTLRKRLKQLTFMVQKEVGERIVAQPGCKAYGPLSIALQYWFECQLEFFVPPEAFEPRPKVTSVVLTLYPRPEGLCPVNNLATMQRIIRGTFQQRRKMLRNTLVHDGILTLERMEEALAVAGISSDARPETLSIEDFARVANAVDALPRQT